MVRQFTTVSYGNTVFRGAMLAHRRAPVPERQGCSAVLIGAPRRCADRRLHASLDGSISQSSPLRAWVCTLRSHTRSGSSSFGSRLSLLASAPTSFGQFFRG